MQCELITHSHLTRNGWRCNYCIISFGVDYIVIRTSPNLFPSLPLVSIVDYFWLTCTRIVGCMRQPMNCKESPKYTNIMYSSCGLHANTARVGNRITRKWRVSTSRIPRWTILQTLIKTHDIRFMCIGTSQSSWWGIQCANAYTCHMYRISTNFLWDVREILY